MNTQMNFFKQLSGLIDNMDVTLTIRKTNNELTILLQPKGTKDGMKTQLKPLNIKGTAEELDEQFFATISAPMQKAVGVIASIEVFEKDIENSKKAVEEEARKKRESTGKKSTPAKPQTPVTLPSEENNNGTNEKTDQVTEPQPKQESLF